MARVPPGHRVREILREAGAVFIGAEEVADECDPQGPKRPKMEIMTGVVPGREDVRRQPSAWRG